jgi:uncharacterized SAM-dependent methyltransferase
MKINDLTFKELLKRKYFLENKTRVWNLADSKLWYLTPDQAQGFLDLENNETYKRSVADTEMRLIKENMSTLLKNLKERNYNVIDLGCGDGKKAILIIKEFNKTLKIRYCPIDISAYMVNKAAETIRTLNAGEVVEFKWNISDFENLSNITPLLREGEFKNHFLMLLGNTLGNFDRDDILNGIKESMHAGDYLLIGNSLNISNQEEIVEPYKDPLLDRFLVKVVEQIGLTKDDVKYDARFNKSRVEMFFTVTKDRTIKYLNKKVDFKVGDIILVAISYRLNKREFNTYLKRFFRNVSLFTDKQDSYAITLCNN